MSVSAASTRSGGAARLTVAPASVMLVMDVLRLFVKKAGAYPYYLVWVGYVITMLQTFGFAFSPMQSSSYDFAVLRPLSYAVYAPSAPLYLRAYGDMPYVVCTVLLYVSVALELLACALLVAVAARPILLERRLVLHVLRGTLESIAGWLYIPLLNLYFGTLMCGDGGSGGSGGGAATDAVLSQVVYNYPTQTCHDVLHTSNSVFAVVGVVVTCALALLMTFVYDDNIDCGHLFARAHNGLDVFVVVAKTTLCLVLHVTYARDVLVVLDVVTLLLCALWLGAVVCTLPYYSITAAALQCACLTSTMLCALVNVFAHTRPLFGPRDVYAASASVVVAGGLPLVWLLGYQLASVRVYALSTCRLRTLAYDGMVAEHVAELPYPRTLAVREQRVMAGGVRAVEKDLVQEMAMANDSHHGSFSHADAALPSMATRVSSSGGGGGSDTHRHSHNGDDDDDDEYTRYYYAAQRLHAMQRRRSSGSSSNNTNSNNNNNHNGDMRGPRAGNSATAAATAAQRQQQQQRQQRSDSFDDHVRLERHRRRGELRRGAVEFLVPYVQRVYLCTDVEVATRFLHAFRVHTSDALKLSPEQLVFALRMFVYGLVYFHQSPYVLVCLAGFLQQHCHRPGVALEVLRDARRRHDARVTTNAVVLYKSYRLEKAIYEDMGVRDRTHLFALRHARSHHREALMTTMRLWTALHEHEDVVSLVHVQDQLALLRELALKRYKLALSTSHDDRTALFSFSAFVEDLFADEELAQNIRQTIDEIELQKKNRMLRGAKAKSRLRVPTIQFADMIAALHAHADHLGSGGGGGGGDGDGSGGGDGGGGVVAATAASSSSSSSSADARGQRALTTLLYALLLSCLALCCFAVAWADQRARAAARDVARILHINAALDAGYRFVYHTQSVLIYDKEHNCTADDINSNNNTLATTMTTTLTTTIMTTTTQGGSDAWTLTAPQDARTRCKDDTTRMQLLQNLALAARDFARENARITSGAYAAPKGSLTFDYVTNDFRPMSFLRVDPYFVATAFLANGTTASMYRKLADVRDALAVAQVQELAGASAMAMMSELYNRAAALTDATQAMRFVVDGPLDTFLSNMYTMINYTVRDVEANTQQLILGVVLAAVVFVLLLLLIAFVFHIKVKWIARNRAALMSLFTCIPDYFLAQLRERNAERLSVFDAQTNARDEANGDETGGGDFAAVTSGDGRDADSGDDTSDDGDSDGSAHNNDDNADDGMGADVYDTFGVNDNDHAGGRDADASMTSLQPQQGQPSRAASGVRRRGRDRKRRSQAFVRALLDMQPLPSCLKKPPALASMMASITTATSYPRYMQQQQQHNVNHSAAAADATAVMAMPPSSSSNHQHNNMQAQTSASAYPLVTVIDDSTTTTTTATNNSNNNNNANNAHDATHHYNNSVVSSGHLPLLSSATMMTTATSMHALAAANASSGGGAGGAKKTVRFSLRARDLADRPRARLHEPKVTLSVSGSSLVADFEKSLVELDQAIERETQAAQHSSERHNNVDTLIHNNYNAQWLRIHKRLSAVTTRVSTLRKVVGGALLLLLVLGVVNIVLMVVFVDTKRAIATTQRQGIMDKWEMTDYITAYRRFDTNVANYLKSGDDDTLSEVVRYFFIDQNYLDLLNNVGNYTVLLSRSYVNDLMNITAHTLRLVLSDVIYTVLGARAMYALLDKDLRTVPYVAAFAYSDEEAKTSALLRFYADALASPEAYVIPTLATLPDDATAMYSIVATLQRRKRYHDDEAAVNTAYRDAIARRDDEVLTQTAQQQRTSATLEYVTVALNAVTVLGAGALAYVTRRRRLHVCMTLLLLVAAAASATTLVLELVLTRQSASVRDVYATSLPFIEEALDYRRFISRRATLVEQYIYTADDTTLQEIWQYAPDALQGILDGLRASNAIDDAQLRDLDVRDRAYWNWQQISLFLSYASHAKQRCPDATVSDWYPPSPPFIAGYNADGNIVAPRASSSSATSSAYAAATAAAASGVRACMQHRYRTNYPASTSSAAAGDDNNNNNNNNSSKSSDDSIVITFGTDEVPFSTPDVDLLESPSRLQHMAYYAAFGSRSSAIFRGLIDENNKMPPTLMTHYAAVVTRRGTIEARLYGCIATVAVACAAVCGASLVPFVRFVLHLVEGGYGRLVRAVTATSYRFATRVVLVFVVTATMLFVADVVLIAVATRATSDATAIATNATTRTQAMRRAAALLAYANYTISMDSYLVALTATRQLRDVLPLLRDTRTYLYFRSSATTGGYDHVASFTDEQKALLFEHKVAVPDVTTTTTTTTSMTTSMNATIDDLYEQFVDAVEQMSNYEPQLVPVASVTRNDGNNNNDNNNDNNEQQQQQQQQPQVEVVPRTKMTFVIAPEQKASIVQLVTRADAYATVVLAALAQSNALYAQQCNAAVYRGVYPAIVLFVVQTLLIAAICVLGMPRLTRRIVREENESRLLLKTIPRRIHDAVPAIAMYMDSGVIDGAALREAKAAAPPPHDIVAEFLDVWLATDAAGGPAATAEAFALLNTLPHGVVLTDETGTIVYANDALHALLHRDEDEADALRGKGIEVFMHPGVAASHGQFMAHYMQRRESLAGRLTHPRRVDVYTREGEAVSVALVLAEAPAKYSRMHFVCELQPSKPTRARRTRGALVSSSSS